MNLERFDVGRVGGVAADRPGLSVLVIDTITRNAVGRRRQRGSRTTHDVLVRGKATGLLRFEHPVGEDVLRRHIEIRLHLSGRRVPVRMLMLFPGKPAIEAVHLSVVVVGDKRFTIVTEIPRSG